jgi:fimbrial chaperone protein
MRLAIAMAAVAMILSPTGQSLAFESAGVTVSPVRIDFGPAAGIDAVTVTNHQSHPITFQVSILSWTQVAGVDALAPSDALIAAPIIFTVAAGASKVVRFGLRAAADQTRETDYRVFLTEIPSEPSKSLTVALRFSLPVFVTPAKPIERLRWSGQQLAHDAYRISLSNDGNVHAHLCLVKMFESGAARLLYQGVWSAYVLPGQTRAWKVQLKETPRSGAIALTAQCAEGTLRAEMPAAVP